VKGEIFGWLLAAPALLIIAAGFVCILALPLAG
jgi:hypothetical protein